MSDEQVAAIKKFVQDGGALRVYRDETTINGKPFKDVLGDAPQWEPGQDMPGMAPLTTRKGFARGLRFSVFVKDEPKRMTLHAVNYNVALREKTAEVTEVKDTSVTLPLPDGLTVTSVKAHDPDREYV